MHVVFINYGYPGDVSDPDALLARFEGLAGWADGVVQAGGQASVIQRFGRDARLQRGNVAYRFVADGPQPALRSWQRAPRVQAVAVALCRETVAAGGQAALHVNGLMYGVQARLLRRLLPRPVPIVVQHHAEQPPAGRRAPLARWGLRAADGFFFTAAQQADPWRAARLMLPAQPVFSIMEGSTGFCYQERAAARRITGMAGDPAFLWVGQLIERKDPLTTLRALEPVFAQRPAARLTMAYTSDDLLPAVTACIASSPALASRVSLLGALPHPEMEAVYNSADIFVLGSRREGSGYALAEALACGVVPAVTDIPSFRWMTDDGRVGALWPPGDPAAGAAAIERVLQRPLADQSAAARRCFEERLSFAAIGRQALAAYRALAARRA